MLGEAHVWGGKMKTVKVGRELTISFPVGTPSPPLPARSQVRGRGGTLPCPPARQTECCHLPAHRGALLPPPGYLERMVAALLFLLCFHSRGCEGKKFTFSLVALAPPSTPPARCRSPDTDSVQVPGCGTEHSQGTEAAALEILFLFRERWGGKKKERRRNNQVAPAQERVPTGERGIKPAAFQLISRGSTH